MSLSIEKVTKTTTKLVTEEVPTGEVVIRLSEPIYRRIGRVLLAHANNVQPYHGPQTNAAVREFVAGMGYTEENTRPR